MKNLFYNSNGLIQALITTIKQDIANDSYEKRSFKEVYAELNRLTKSKNPSAGL